MERGERKEGRKEGRKEVRNEGKDFLEERTSSHAGEYDEAIAFLIHLN